MESRKRDRDNWFRGGNLEIKYKILNEELDVELQEIQGIPETLTHDEIMQQHFNQHKSREFQSNLQDLSKHRAELEILKNKKVQFQAMHAQAHCWAPRYQRLVSVLCKIDEHIVEIAKNAETCYQYLQEQKVYADMIGASELVFEDGFSIFKSDF